MTPCIVIFLSVPLAIDGHADLPVAVSVFGLCGMLGLLLLDCSSSSPDVTLQNHLEQCEVDVDQTLCQITPSCNVQSNVMVEDTKERKPKECRF